jgi:putative ABC transport system ATP-binding protein
MAIIETQDLTKTYVMGKDNVVQALQGVTVMVDKGEFLSLIGRSGSGKTTMLNMIGCLDRPTSGKVFIEGQEVSRLSKNKLAEIRQRKIGFVFQQYNLIPTLTALENVMLPMRYAGLSGKEMRQRALWALEQVELMERMNHQPKELSGGQQQRVAIARALVNQPAIILADEPTGSVDSTTAAAIMKLLRRLNKDMGQTVLIVTHDMGVANNTDRIIQMNDGQVVRDESRDGRSRMRKLDLPMLKGRVLDEMWASPD